MDSKPAPHRTIYVETLRAMTSEERLLKAFELTEMTRQLLLDGLRERFPGATEAEIRRHYLERLDRCHNRPC